ncbi:signal peptidase I [Psychrobacillus sp. NPDC096623]|uniref:signal peptidase I n=1 Tax=Psychrobacillus sp. NPDC096623 TaxID=3364492 RepID=UPI0038145C34
MNNFKKEMLEWLTALVIGILLVMFIRMFLVTNYEVVGQSMMPTLHDKDKVLVNKLSKIDHMDIVIFHGDEEEDYVKRVIGLPGDMISYKNDELFINNKKVKEPYLQSFSAYDNPDENFTEDFELDELTGSKRVPPDKLFVLGDNRISSMDSRYFHFVDTTEVVGEVQARYWPLSQATTQFYSE